ncbi:MAG: ferrous iron transport protein B [Bacteroidia bacterium]|nr:ferrous iron transport protein B [Bacteroidia bacterium]NNM16922.1 ferrous iron transport protein B [Bacteroidia bacterium]
MKEDKLKVALVGNPNSGKSTIFNALTGLKQKIANFPGVTVDKRLGTCKVGENGNSSLAEILDLPGIYSLYPKSLDEQIPFHVLCDPKNNWKPDKIIVIADGTNLKRSLFLCSQIVDLKIPTILSLNMMDLVKKQGLRIDIAKLQETLGIKVVPLSALKGFGLNEIKKSITEDITVPEKDFLDGNDKTAAVIKKIKEKLPAKSNYAALQLAHNIDNLKGTLANPEIIRECKSFMQELEYDPQEMQAAETLERYKLISKILEECVSKTDNKGALSRSLSHKIDDVLTHKVWGFAIFIVILFVVFQAIFAWASYPMDFIEYAFAQLSGWTQSALPEGPVNDLVVNGVLAGLGGVVIFIPQIALLFAFVALLEDSGYMARVSFIMDKLLRRFGLNGRSVIPLVSGVACAVPAIMSARTIHNWKERLITILVTPLMSCSARLPVYTLLIALVIPSENIAGVINIQGLVLMGMYLIGFLAALFAAGVFKLILKSNERPVFIMEMPNYRAPRWTNILYSIIEKVKVFLFEAGKVIIAISIVLWVLSSYGPPSKMAEVDKKYETELAKLSVNDEIQSSYNAEKLESSFAGILGKSIEPAIAPLGFDWKIGIALITSFAAREVFVGTMSTIYSVGQEGKSSLTVREKMMAEKVPGTDMPRYSFAVGISLMLFYAFALQCMSTLAIVRRELASWKWPIIQFLFMGALAYFFSLFAYQLLK